MWLFILLILVLCSVILRWRQKSFLKRCRLREAPALNVPFLGHAVNFIGNSETYHKTLTKLSRLTFGENNDPMGIWMGTQLFICTADAANAEFVLKTCMHKGGPTDFIRMVTGDGLLFADVPTWRQRRKIVAPLFTPKNLSLFVEVFARLSKKLSLRLRKAVPGPSQLGSYFHLYAFDAVCNTTLGIDLDIQNNEEHPFLKSFAVGAELIAARIVSPWLYNDIVYRLTPAYRKVMYYKRSMYDFVYEIILDKKEEARKLKENPKLSENNNKILALTELLIRSNENGALTLTGQAEEALVMVMAGTDTSALTISYVLHMLSRNLDVQEKLYRELMNIFGDDANKTVTDDDLPKLDYLECVIKETLRLFPPIPIIARTPDTDVTLPSGKILPKGCTIVIGLYGLHRNPFYWGADADQFRPERFLEPFKHPKQFMPFSDGPRNCVGYKYAILSMKTALAVILRKYKVFPSDSSKIWNSRDETSPKNADDALKLQYKIVLKEKNNVFLRLEPRCES